MSDENLHVCQRHPEREVTARCVRFDRRFCELDFEGTDPAECLSPTSYCEYRQQCLVWQRYRENRKRELRNGASGVDGESGKACD